MSWLDWLRDLGTVDCECQYSECVGRPMKTRYPRQDEQGRYLCEFCDLFHRDMQGD